MRKSLPNFLLGGETKPFFGERKHIVAGFEGSHTACIHIKTMTWKTEGGVIYCTGVPVSCSNICLLNGTENGSLWSLSLNYTYNSLILSLFCAPLLLSQLCRAYQPSMKKNTMGRHCRMKTFLRQKSRLHEPSRILFHVLAVSNAFLKLHSVLKSKSNYAIFNVKEEFQCNAWRNYRMVCGVCVFILLTFSNMLNVLSPIAIPHFRKGMVI